MREHKYKAKRLDNNKWVEGYYWQNWCGNHFIRTTVEHGRIMIKDYEIDPETLCEFIGLYDKNKKEVWKHDIVDVLGFRYLISYGYWNCPCCYDVYGWVASGLVSECDILRNVKEDNLIDGEVIGNIFDNPVLLEEC